MTNEAGIEVIITLNQRCVAGDSFQENSSDLVHHENIWYENTYF